MSQQKIDLALRGLFTSPNNLGGVPAGALTTADNVVINSKSLIESRRGQTQYGDPLAIGSGQINKLFNYASSLIVNYTDKMAYDSGAGNWIDYTGTYLPPSSDSKMRSLEALKNFYFTTSKGVYKIDSLAATPVAAGVVRALGGTYVLSGGSGFLSNDSAVAYRIVWGYTDANNNLILGAPSQRLVAQNSSGGSKGVTLTYAIPDTVAPNYFYQLYRSLAVTPASAEPTDELQLVAQGIPTTGELSAKSITIVDSTPESLMRATLYTSPSQQGIANANNPPPFAVDMDVFKTCAFYANVRQKQSLTLAIIGVDSPSLGYVVDASVGITDMSTTLTGVTTADLRVGMRAVGTDIPSGAYITSIGATTVTISTAATATGTISVEFQDSFTIGGVDYWAGSSQDVSVNQFLVDTSGTPGQNIDSTAENLVNLINVSSANTTLYAYYISGLEDLPGQILFEERSIGGDSFEAYSTAGASFSPALQPKQYISSNTLANPTIVTTLAPHGLTTGDVIVVSGSNSNPTLDGDRTVTVLSPTTFSVPVNVTIAGTAGIFVLKDEIIASDNEARQNRVYISKASQVEAVPVYRYFDIGSANFPIQRVVALRDGIFFFKADGIYRISGETFESFTVALVDNTVILKVPESAVAFNSQVFCFTTQGIVAVTDSGVQLMSVPIENTLLELSSDQFVNFVPASFGIAYESARSYIFCTVSKEEDTVATQAYVYNSLTDSWTRWIMDRTCGVVNTSVNKLFMGQPDTGQVLIERKSYTNDDFADEQYPVVISSVDSDTSVTLSDASEAVIGMSIVQGGRKAIILDIDGDVLEVTTTQGFEAGDAVLYTPIDNFVEWTPIDCENPGILKQFSEVSLFFKSAPFRDIDANFQTNISDSRETVPITNNTGKNGWGRFLWGQAPWGGALGGQAVVLRTYIPQEQQRGSWLFLGLRTNQAFTGFSLQGVSLMYNPMSSRQR